ncbi:MAG: hypothetical protein ACTH4U_15855 [Pseudoalteromonas prydzensis]|uniref:hypothetical protein n=1 Tax=Pseudoalteromonas prydzensis TaxID=182141 RepID=UPI003F951508
MLNKITAITALLFTSAALAQDSDGLIDVKIANSSLVSAEQSKSTVFHVTMPSNSALIATVYGGDTIKAVFENSSAVQASISGSSGIWVISKVGQYSFAATTKCGLSFSIVANVVTNYPEKPRTIDAFKPKVAIQSAKCEESKL